MNSLAQFAIKVVVSLVALLLLGEYVNRTILSRFNWEKAADVKATATKDAVANVIVVDHKTAPARTRYIETRDRVRAHPKPSKPLVDTLIADADSTRAADSLRIVARDSALKTALSEIDHLKNKPGPARLTAYGEGMWDLARQVPVIRAGADLRLLKGLSLTAAIDATPRDRTIETRAMVGARYTFR